MENGFRFSKSKTNAIHFCNKHKLHNDPELLLGQQTINVVKEAKSLGIIFDSKLNFLSHIKSLKTKCLKALNIIKCVSGTKWGGDQKTLLNFYRALVRSKLDYGSIIYGSARKSYLKSYTVRHQGLRLALGAFRTSLYVEADEPSLSERRVKLSLQYITKLKSNPTNPAYECVFEPVYTTSFERKTTAISPLGVRMKDHILFADIPMEDIQPTKYLSFPPWQLVKLIVNMDLTKLLKSYTNTLVFQKHFSELKTNYTNYVSIYTDGSKDGTSVTSAGIINKHTISRRLPDRTSVFWAETKAIELALQHVKHCNIAKVIIFSDSLSCLQAIKYSQLKNPLILDILELH